MINNKIYLFILQFIFKTNMYGRTYITNNKEQEAWRPKVLYKYIQFYDLKPDFIVDITGFMALKMESILAHPSQFYNPNSDEPETLIASKSFFESIEARARENGRVIYAEYGEGFLIERVIGVDDLFAVK